MVACKVRGGRRRGAAAVETALVILPVLLFMYGIYEYGRFVLDLNLFNNAAREGCRYALANNTSGTITTDVQNVVNGYMAGRNTTSFANFTVTLSGTHNGANVTDVTTLVAGDFITVKVSGNYKFLNLPMLHLPTMALSSACTMVCEGVS